DVWYQTAEDLVQAALAVLPSANHVDLRVGVPAAVRSGTRTPAGRRRREAREVRGGLPGRGGRAAVGLLTLAVVADPLHPDQHEVHHDERLTVDPRAVLGHELERLAFVAIHEGADVEAAHRAGEARVREPFSVAAQGGSLGIVLERDHVLVIAVGRGPAVAADGPAHRNAARIDRHR